MTTDLSPDQEEALADVIDWLDGRGEHVFKLAGLAGTGKTTLIRAIVAWCRQNEREVEVCAYTGKAAHVLRRKGIPMACTLHSLMYLPVYYCQECRRTLVEPADLPKGAAWNAVCQSEAEDCAYAGQSTRLKLDFVERTTRDTLPFVIVDEASMLSADHVDTVQSVTERVLLVGDPGQLPPVQAEQYFKGPFTRSLTKIHRQAEGSDILDFAAWVREGRDPRRWPKRDDSVEVTVTDDVPDDAFEYDQVLVATNMERIGLASMIRADLGFDAPSPEAIASGTAQFIPYVDDLLICVDNNPRLGVFNGMFGRVAAIHSPQGDSYVMDIEVVDPGPKAPKMLTSLPVYRGQFGQERKCFGMGRRTTLWDFANAITVHKAQGSEWNRVIVHEGRYGGWVTPAWRYTAATRAAKELVYSVR